MDKIVGALLTAILAIVIVVSLSYYIVSQPNQTQNNPSPTPTPTPEPTPTITPSPSETPTGQGSIYKPNVPEFTVEFVSGAVKIKIKNQPFVDYYDANVGNTIFFYYTIRVKEHTSTNWRELYHPSWGFLHQDDLSEYTEVSYSSNKWGYETVSFSSGTQVDIQVEAMIGSIHRDASTYWAPWIFDGETSGWSETQTITLL